MNFTTKTKFIWRLAFIIILFYVTLTYYTMGARSLSDVTNFYIIECKPTYPNNMFLNKSIQKCDLPNNITINAGEYYINGNLKINIFFETAFNFMFLTLLMAFYISWLHKPIEVKNE